jgi:hypothetical protein
MLDLTQDPDPEDVVEDLQVNGIESYDEDELVSYFVNQVVEEEYSPREFRDFLSDPDTHPELARYFAEGSTMEDRSDILEAFKSMVDDREYDNLEYVFTGEEE